MMTVELNGVQVEREDVRAWLLAKRCTLWADWCVTDPKRIEPAIDWFMGQMSELALSKAPAKPVNGKKVKKNGSRSASRSTR